MTWEEFNDAVRVHLVAHNRRQGVQDYIDALIKAGATDLQKAIEFYQVGHETVFDPATDLTESGFASRGTMVDGKFMSAWLTEYDVDEDTEDTCEKRPVDLVASEHIPDFKCGNFRFGEYYIAIDRTGGYFFVTPQVEDTMRLHLQWVGVKTDWVDADETPFDERVAECVADYVLARLARTVDRDPQAAASHHQSFVQQKRTLFLEPLDRQRMGTANVSADDGGSESAELSLSSFGAQDIPFLRSITQWAGSAGDTTALAGIPTTAITRPYVVRIMVSGDMEEWTLADSTDATVAGTKQRPADYDADTNACVWFKTG